MQTQLLLNVVPYLVMRGVLEILQRERQKSAAGQRSHPFGHRSEGFLTDLVSSESVARVHDQLFPTLVVLSSIQTGTFADIFYLQRRRRGEGRRSERKQNEKLTRSASCSNNVSLLSAFSGVRLELYNSLWRSEVETHCG